MYILGLVEGHNCSAALLCDGELVAVCFEERFSRLKNDLGFPFRAIDYCLSEAGIGPEDVDHVAMVTENLPFGQVAVKREATFSVADHLREQEEYWKPVLIEGRSVDFLSVFRDKLCLDDIGYDLPAGLVLDRSAFATFQTIRHETVKRRLRKRDDQIHIIHHHLAHSLYAVFSAPDAWERDRLVLVADGYGDDCSASVGTWKQGQFEFIAKSIGSGVGRIYRYAVLLLGMKPGVDEYKMMGLAPYAKEYHWRPVYEAMGVYLRVDGMEIHYTNPDKDIFFSLKERLKPFRFDAIAAGVQAFCEDVSRDWVRNAVTATGLRDVVYSGGVSMNVKVNKRIVELDEVDDLFVGPTGGDESLSVGAAWALWHQLHGSARPVKPLAHPYLGPSYGEDAVRAAVAELLPADGFEVTTAADDDEVAGLLADGLVIGRARGRMEYGARALGNRSILARADDPMTIRRINDQIKQRDFWMPFAPMILEECAADYLVNPKKISTPYMTIGFDSTPLARLHLRAALHPADDTMRPQVVSMRQNPGMHALLTAFRAKSGMGGLLNTSLNLHGQPLCCSPADSLRTFLASDLDGLSLDGMVVLRAGRRRR